MSQPTIIPTEKKVRKPRRDCKYTLNERAIIAVYKDKYQSETTSAGCGHIFRSNILPAIFNYWTETGKINDIWQDIESEAKVQI